jgi:hypothetical protein
MSCFQGSPGEVTTDAQIPLPGTSFDAKTKGTDLAVMRWANVGFPRSVAGLAAFKCVP